MASNTLTVLHSCQQGRTMKASLTFRIACMRLLLLLLLTCLALSPANATPFDAPAAQGNNPFGASQSIPSVDQAMPLSVKQDADGGLIVHFSLLDHVYLYRPQLTLTPLDANKLPLAFVTPFVLPTGSAHEDDEIGRAHV